MQYIITVCNTKRSCFKDFSKSNNSIVRSVLLEVFFSLLFYCGCYFLYVRLLFCFRHPFSMVFLFYLCLSLCVDCVFPSYHTLYHGHYATCIIYFMHKNETFVFVCILQHITSQLFSSCATLANVWNNFHKVNGKKNLKRHKKSKDCVEGAVFYHMHERVFSLFIRFHKTGGRNTHQRNIKQFTNPPLHHLAISMQFIMPNATKNCMNLWTDKCTCVFSVSLEIFFSFLLLLSFLFQSTS